MLRSTQETVSLLGVHRAGDRVWEEMFILSPMLFFKILSLVPVEGKIVINLF